MPSFVAEMFAVQRSTTEACLWNNVQIVSPMIHDLQVLGSILKSAEVFLSKNSESPSSSEAPAIKSLTSDLPEWGLSERRIPPLGLIMCHIVTIITVPDSVNIT